MPCVVLAQRPGKEFLEMVQIEYHLDRYVGLSTSKEKYTEWYSTSHRNETGAVLVAVDNVSVFLEK